MVKRQDRSHPCPEVIASRPIPVVAKLRHELVPAFRDVSIVDSDLGWTTRESISGQGGDNYIEIAEHRQKAHIIEKSARPSMCEDQWRPPTRPCTLVYEMNAFPGEVVEGVKPLFPGAPVELVGPIRHDVLQPV